jgi:hypothetical protein
MSSIGNLASGLLHAVLPSSLILNNMSASSLTSAASSPVTQRPDVARLSSFAQLAGTLQQLQQSNPAQYQQVTEQIAANLQSAVQTAQSSGNTTAATQLSQRSADFSSASASGQLPNLQDLAHAVGGHGYHGGTSSGSAVNQFLSSLQANGAQSSVLNAATIIQNALTSAGIGQ